MLKLSVLVPDATINYIKNPSLRYNTTDWNSSGATLTRSLDQARFGISSLKVVTAGSVLREGAYYRVNALAGVSSPVTASAYVVGTGKVRLRLIDNPTGKEWFTQPATLRTDRFTRLWATGNITGSNDVRVYIETDEGTAKARTFYVDGVQLELKAYPTSYCDGDREGCRWTGLFHSSSSQRLSDTRAGGRWVQIGGEERQEENLYMTVIGGLGMASIKNHIQPYALQPGSHFGNYKIDSRAITLAFHTKNVDKLNSETTISLSALHELRQFLIDLFKPDKTGHSEDMWFEYQDGDLPLYFQARYDGGLEGEWDIRNQWVNSFPLRLIAVSPLMVEDNQQVSSLDFQDTLPINIAIGRVNGQWINMNYGVNWFIASRGMVMDKFGGIYAIAVSNTLTVINNNAAAITPLQPARAVVYWDGEKWRAIGSPVNMGGSGTLSGIAISPTGDVYVTGSFSSIGGVAAANIARWDGSAWNALGTGLNAAGSVVKVDTFGRVYAGGLFTAAGGVTCYRIAWYDGTWHQLGTYRGLDSNVHSIAISKDGSTLYVGGEFLDEQGVGGNNLVRVASYDVLAGTFSPMGSRDASVVVMKIAPNNLVYAGGQFSDPNGIAVWNGSSWASLGNSIVPSVSQEGNLLIELARDIDFFPNGDILIVGSYSSNTFSGKVFTRQDCSVWNGSIWRLLDKKINAPGSGGSLASCLVSPFTGDIYMAENAIVPSTVMQISGRTTVTNNGTAKVHPSVYISGPGKILWLENQTIQKKVFLDLELLSGEEAVIDFGNGTIRSSIRGDIFHTLLAGSDFRAFELIPGENIITCFMTNDISAQIQMSYTPQHWGMDATG